MLRLGQSRLYVFLKKKKARCHRIPCDCSFAHDPKLLHTAHILPCALSLCVAHDLKLLHTALPLPAKIQMFKTKSGKCVLDLKVNDLRNTPRLQTKKEEKKKEKVIAKTVAYGTPIAICRLKIQTLKTKGGKKYS